jgi:hypothetical protein
VLFTSTLDVMATKEAEKRQGRLIYKAIDVCVEKSTPPSIAEGPFQSLAFVVVVLSFIVANTSLIIG